MSSIGKIVIYLIAVLASAVLLSPPIYWLCQWLIAQGNLEFLRGFPFHRYFSRTLQVSAIVLLVPLFFSLGIRNLRALGLKPDRRRLLNWAGGFFAGLLPVALFAGIVLWTGIYQWRANADPEKLLRIACTALVVGGIEEFLFRGILLGLLVNAFGKIAGLMISSAIFAVVHFLRPTRPAHSGPVTWTSGWEQLISFTQSWPEGHIFAYGLATLFVAGAILALLRLRTSALWGAFGMHAGWIFAQQSLNHFAKFRPTPVGEYLPWIGPSLVSGVVPTGLAPLGVLLLGALLAWKWVR